MPSGYTAITSATQLSKIGAKRDEKWILMNDIDLSDWDNWPYVDGHSITLDGNGYTIKNLMVNDEEYTGFFRLLYGTSYIKNLGLENSKVTSPSGNELLYHYSGAFAGYVGSSLTIENCYNMGDINSESPQLTGYAGGFIGTIQSKSTVTIKDSYNRGSVTSSGKAGGFVGYSSSPLIIENSYNDSYVSSGHVAGGFVGYSFKHPITVEKSFNKGAVSTTIQEPQYCFAGGLIGSSMSPIIINRSYNSGDIGCPEARYSRAAGLIAWAYTWEEEVPGSLSISNSYNNGKIYLTNDETGNFILLAGGLVCSPECPLTIEKSYNSGIIEVNSDIDVSNKIIGAFAATLPSVYSISNSFYKDNAIDAFGHSAGDGSMTNCSALTDEQMRDKSSFAGFDFDSIWEMSDDGYPVLRKREVNMDDYDWNNYKTDIYFDANGGNAVSEKITVQFNSKLASLPKATRKGYLHKGWYTQRNGGSLISDGTVVNDTIPDIIYAQWDKVTVKKPSIKKIKKLKNRKAKITINKVKGCEGCQIKYATNKKFKKSKTTSTTKLTKTISNLKKGKTYYFKVRAYKYDSTGAKVYSKNSKHKKIKIRK